MAKNGELEVGSKTVLENVRVNSDIENDITVVMAPSLFMAKHI